MTMIQSKAPAKLILAGEHTVVQGHPAIAVAIEQYTHVCLEPIPFSAIHWQFDDLDYYMTQPIAELHEVYQRLNQNYHAFSQGESSVKTILQHPSELAQYLLSLFAGSLDHQHGLRIRIKSDIPMGCGLGSSSALIISLISAIDHYHALQLSQTDYLQFGRQAEHLQHGNSSGLDLQATYHGGCLLVQQQKILDQWYNEWPLYIVNTGESDVSTGECVDHTQKILNRSTLGGEIADLTQQLYEALQQNNVLHMKATFNALHRCLTHLGVVPTKVQEFVHGLEQQGAAAKVCGAGSVHGDKAGIVCIISEENPSDLCRQFNYHCQKVQISQKGVQHD
jgi:mevalonate kinase